MAETTLRAYVREIDNLIEREQLDEAIAHCRHILQSYPKHIECYRLLGKAYLEAKRYGDAADIFQRVLSAVPDDFVSHIGMSIVREDEGNLDSAIWHMERAFETNPANPAIQQELKRLIGRQEGFEPHKVRLTRGALARMYAHGELYPQAIAELRSALQEDAERPDLQVLLANMYWQTDQRVEAAEVSGQILEKLPYCLQAVRIMAAAFLERGKEDEAAVYHRRLAQLDPYMAYIETPMAEPTRVEADTIRVERLSWQPGQPLPASESADSEWAAALGLDVDEPTEQEQAKGPLPSWLDDVEPEAEEESPAIEMSADQEMPQEPPAEGEEGEDGEIPEWMQEAGWQESSGEAEEAPVSFSAEELNALEQGELPAEPEESDGDEGELEPAEIPSWLQGMAPPEQEAGDDEAESEEDRELVSWLTGEGAEQADADSSEQPTVMDEPAAELEADEEASDVPGWLDEGEPGATSTIMTWLGDRDEEDEQSPSQTTEDWPPQDVEKPEAEQDDSGEETADEQEAPPSWLTGVAQAAADAGADEGEELEQFRQQAQSQDIESDEPAESDEGDIPGWLRSIAGEEDSEQATDQAAPEPIESEETLSWDAGVDAAEQDTIPQQPGADEEDDAPDWLRGFGDEQAEQEAPAPEPASTESAGGAEDWLAELASEPGAGELDDEADAWLSQLGEEEEAAEAAQASAGEDVPDWMDGLAEEEEEAPDDVEELASGWLSDLSDTLAETPAEPGTQEADSDWLSDLAEEEPEPEGAQAPAAPASDEEEEKEDLEWLHRLDPDKGPEDEPAAAELEVDAAEPDDVADLEDLDEEGVFDWLDEMAARQEQADETSPSEAEPQAAPAEAQVSDEAPPESYEEGLDWLDQLADKRGIDADIERQPSSSRPVEPRTTQEPEAAAPEEPTSDEPAQPRAPEAPTSSPDRLAEETAQEAEPTAQQPAMPTPDQAEEFEDEAAEAAAEVPDWLAAEAFDEQPAPADEAEATEATPAPPDEPPATEPPQPDPAAPAETAVPTQMESERAAPSEEPSEQEVPDWLAEHGEGVTIDEEEAAAQTAVGEQAEEPAPEQPQAEQTVPPAEAAERPAEVPDHAELTEPAQAADQPEPPSSPEQEQPAEPEAVEPEPSTQQPAAPSDPLTAARQALAAGDIGEATAQYGKLIEARTSLNQVVEDLEAALEGEHKSPRLWQALGDAYMKLERTKDAVRAYGDGMEKNEALENARQALAAGDHDRASVHYSVLIKRKSSLDDVIDDLSHATEEDGTPILWQTLGDAYMKAGRLDDSIRAYRKGMDTV